MRGYGAAITVQPLHGIGRLLPRDAHHGRQGVGRGRAQPRSEGHQTPQAQQPLAGNLLACRAGGMKHPDDFLKQQLRGVQPCAGFPDADLNRHLRHDRFAKQPTGTPPSLLAIGLQSPPRRAEQRPYEPACLIWPGSNPVYVAFRNRGARRIHAGKLFYGQHASRRNE